MSGRRFLLIDENGTPRDERYQTVAEEIGKRFANREWYLDSADLDNLLGTTGDNVAAREVKWGRLEDFPGFRAYFWKSFLNRLSCLSAQSEYKIKRGKVALDQAEPRRPTNIDVWKNDDLVNLHAQLLSGDCFARLSSRDRRILWMKEDGYKAREIAIAVGITEENVNVIVSRARKLVKHIVSHGFTPSQKVGKHREDGDT